MNVQTAAPKCPLPKWTVLVYSAADNNLTPYMMDDIHEIENVGSDSYTNLVAQVDQGGSEGASRYLLQKTDGQGKGITSPAVESMGDVDMADPKTLADFVKWGMDKYPAEHYALIISDHGGGWQGAVEDDSANTWMTLPKLREGLEQAEAQTGRKLDFLGFDACLMASVEVVKELGPHADYMAVSEQTEGADGWGYSQLLNPQLLQTMQQAHMMKINVTPRELAVLSVTQAQSKQDVLPTMTAIDTSKVDGVVAAVDQLGSAIAETETPVSALKDIISDTTSFYGFKDVGHFSNNVLASEQVQDQKIKDAATAVKSALAEAVIAEEHSDAYPNATGLTLEMAPWGVPSGYADTRLAQETHWPAALEKLNSGK
jgi:hypothetical protein